MTRSEQLGWDDRSADGPCEVVDVRPGDGGDRGGGRVGREVRAQQLVVRCASVPPHKRPDEYTHLASCWYDDCAATRGHGFREWMMRWWLRQWQRRHGNGHRNRRGLRRVHQEVVGGLGSFPGEGCGLGGCLGRSALSRGLAPPPAAKTRALVARNIVRNVHVPTLVFIFGRWRRRQTAHPWNRTRWQVCALC